MKNISSKNVHCVNYAIKENIFEKQTDEDKQIWIMANPSKQSRTNLHLHVFIINKKYEYDISTKIKAIECRKFMF